MSKHTLRFHAHCKLTERMTAGEMTPEQHSTQVAAGSPSTWDAKRKAEVWHVQCDETFDDTAKFDAHMAEQHGGGRYAWDPGGLAPCGYRTAKTYRPRMQMPVKLRPMVPRSGKPTTWVDQPGLTLTCATCGLVAERADTQAFDLWWAEHERGCSLVAAAS